MNTEMLIGNAFEAGTGDGETILNPRTGETILTLPEASTEQVQKAVAAAEKAFETWARTTPSERSTLMLKIADRIDAEAKDFAALEALNCGKPIDAVGEDELPAIADSIWLPSKGQVGFGIDFAVRISSPATADENSGEIGEFFWDGRASTLFWVDPENDIAAVLFTQMMPFNTLPVHKTFRDAIYWDDESAAAPRE